MTRFFLTSGQGEINTNHSESCCESGDSKTPCTNCLKESAKILSDPLLHGVSAVKWAMAIDIKENGEHSEYYQHFPKIPDPRAAGGYRMDRRPAWMKENNDPEKLEAHQRKMAETMAKYAADQRMGNKNIGGAKAAQEKK